jgi:hypothetical protein
VFGNRTLRRIFGPKRDEVTRDWRKLHNEELHNLYSSPSIIILINSRRMRWAGHAVQMEAKYRIFVGKSEEKRSLGRPRCRLVNMEMDGVRIDWIDLAQYRDQWRVLVCTVMNLPIQ